MTERIRTLLVLSGLVSLFTSQAWAISNPYDGNWYVAAGAGYSFYSLDGDNDISACSGLPPDHYYKTSLHDSGFVSFTTGYAWTRFDTAFPALMLGVNFSYAFNGEVRGSIDKYSSTAFTNYHYTYDFSRQSLMGVVKLDLFNGNGFMPYITGGAGISFNRASNYQEEALSGVTPRVSPGFGTAFHSAFAYMLGAGVDYAICDDIWVALGYQYGNYGTVVTGHGDVQPSISKDYSHDELENRLRAQSVTLEFTYLINYI